MSTLMLLAGASLLGCNADRQTLEPTYRAAKAIEGAIAVGVTPVRLSELLQNLSTEVTIARERSLSAQGERALRAYAEAVEIYRDSLQLWQLRLRKGDQYLADVDDVHSLRIKHGIPADGNGEIDAESGMQFLWAKAVEKVASAAH